MATRAGDELCGASVASACGHLVWETGVLAAGQAHLLDEVLSISADVVHTVLVDCEVCLESFMFLQ